MVAEYHVTDLSISPSSATPGDRLILRAVIGTGQNTEGHHVQLEIFDDQARNRKLVDQLFMNQAFLPGQDREFATDLVIQSGQAGTYRLSVSVYGPDDWTTKIVDHVAPLKLTIGSSSTPVVGNSDHIPPGYNETWVDNFDGPLRLDNAGTGGSPWATYFVGWNVRHLEGNRDQALKADASYRGDGDNPLGLVLHEQTPEQTLKLHGHLMPNGPGVREQFHGFPYVAGMISGQRSHAQRYGYWEIRTRLPNISKGHHMAFWLVADDNSWPPEIDMLEVVGSTPDGRNDSARFHFNSHGPGQGDISHLVVDQPQDWHVVGFLWTPDDMIWTLDGREVRRRRNYVFDKQFYFMASPEIGGHWPGAPDEATTWPMMAELDYVRIYQKDMD